MKRLYPEATCMMYTLKPTTFHSPLPNIQLVVNNTSVKQDALASFQIVPASINTEAQNKTVSFPTVLLVALLHVFAGMQLMQESSKQPANSSPPMMVTMVMDNKIAPVVEPKLVEPKPIVKPAETKPVVKAPPKVVATTPEKAKIQATEDKPQINEPAPTVAPQITEIAEPAPPTKTAVSETPVKPEPKPEPVYVAPTVGANYLHNPAPEYPQMARRRGEQGRVLIKVLVTSQGDASNVSLEKSSGSSYLDEAAIKAVKHWKFVPARSNNEAVSGYVTVPINFSLES